MENVQKRSRRRPAAVLVLALAVFVSQLGCGLWEATETPPNLVLIVIDTARADHFGSYGYDRPTTPQIDAFARDAVLYRGARSSAPWTLPAHASIFTGLRAGEHGLHFAAPEPEMRDWSTVGRMRDVARDRLIAALLQARGYDTFGVSNNAWVSPKTELSLGFDHFYLLPVDRKPRDQQVGEWLGARPRSSTAAGQSLELFRWDLARGAIGPPFFAFFNLIEPHFPYIPAPAFRGRFGGEASRLKSMKKQHEHLELEMIAGGMSPDPELLVDLYDEELAQVDAAVGEILDELRARGLYDDALIVITSDHGEHLGEGGRYSHQLSMEPELLEVPLIVKYPRGQRAGTTVEHPLISVADIHQTLLAAAWADNPFAGGWSQNLARPEGFDRAWNLAEYYYSPFYLGLLRKMTPEFDPVPHQQIGRVVYTHEAAHRLEPMPGAESRSTLPREVQAQLTDYLQALDRAGPPAGLQLDEATHQSLRELGYVE